MDDGRASAGPRLARVATDPPWLLALRAEVRLRIRAQRSTQAALAAHLGISAKHLNQILTGTVTGTPELLDRIASAVGLRITVALDGEPAQLPRGAWRGQPGFAARLPGAGGEQKVEDIVRSRRD